MSDNESAAANDSTATQFNEREFQFLAWAMQSAKNGPPEIDYVKLAHLAGMSNPRSASNSWAKIKAKLTASAPEGTAPATPKKTAAKKAVTKDKSDDAEGTPEKIPRKRGAKKQDVDGEVAPRKRGRPKKVQDPDTIQVKTETDTSESSKKEGLSENEIEEEV